MHAPALIFFRIKRGPGETPGEDGKPADGMFPNAGGENSNPGHGNFVAWVEAGCA